MSYIVLLYEDHLYHAKAEMPGTFVISSNKKADLKVDALGQGEVKIRENKKGTVSVSCSKFIDYDIYDLKKESITILSEKHKAVLYYSDYYEEEIGKIKLPYYCKMTVGRSADNNIVISNKYVGRKHFIISCEAGIVHVEDLNSANGLYLNGKKISKAKLNSGDVLSIIQINIRYEENELIFDNVGDGFSIQALESDVALGGKAKVNSGMGGYLLYRRSPRTQEQLPKEPIILAPPPSSSGKFEKRRGMFGSFIGSGVMMAASFATTTVSPALLAARAASLVTPITSLVGQSGSEKARKSKMEKYDQLRMEKYGQYIMGQRARIEIVASTQRDIISRENPEASECIKRLAALDRTLWERGTWDRDFGEVRVGMGYETLCVPVQSREDMGFKLETDEQQELAGQIIEETRIVDNVPARLPLRKYQTVGVLGNRHKIISLVKNMLVCLSYSHCFSELRIVGVFDEKEKEVWEAIRWLPHIWDESKQFRYLAFDKNSAEKVMEFAYENIKERIAREEGSYKREAPAVPFYLFIFGSKEYTEKTELLRLLGMGTPELGASVMLLYDDIYSLPHFCQYILDVDNGPCGYEKSNISNKMFFTVDELVTADKFDAYSRALSAIELDGMSAVAEIPRGVTFLNGYGVTRVEELDAWSRWNQSKTYQSLATPIGIMGGNKAFMFDIHAKAHGPHGLVAGTTGSGKSETIISWILSMCINYHPYDVAFVIIDYKGGSMANSLEKLPHVIGKITNIGGGINRTLVSLNAELKRRQRIFAKYQEYEISDINAYQKLYHDGLAKEPLPHLIIVSDEFAELKTNQPDFMKALISAARIGRSLGVHLVLATQKPAGVVDEQINSNSNFRICLKVASSADSREMIKRPDAARITQSGRAYILVGEEDVFEQFQSFYSGSKYNPNAKAQEMENNAVALVDISGVRRKKSKKKNKEVLEEKGKGIEVTELMAIRSYLEEVAKAHEIEKLDGPWLEELPTLIDLDSLRVSDRFDGVEWGKSQEWLKVPIGIYDFPELQQQGVQFYDFQAEGHLGIYGAPSSGKSMLLKSLLVSLCECYTPEEVNIYVMDLGGWGLNVIGGFPHVGGVALDCEEEKFQKLGQMLNDEMNRRKKVFLANGVSSLKAYREAMNGGMPAIIVAIDNIVPIFEAFPDMEGLLIALASQGSTYGMYLVFTANNTTGIRYKVIQNIKGAICFEMTDKGDYTSILGKMDGKMLPKITGRAFMKSSSLIEFQACMYVGGETEKERTDQLKLLIAKMDQVWKGSRPDPIPVMPEELSFGDVFQHYRIRYDIPVGISYESIRYIFAPMMDRYNFLISGSIKSGKSAYLENIAREFRNANEDSKIYVFDSANASLRKTEQLATQYCMVNQDDVVTQILTEIIDQLNVRKRAQNQARSQQGDGFSEEEFIQEYCQIILFIDNLKEFIDAVSNENKNSMERICKLAQGLGVMVFVAGRVSDLEHYYQIESLTRCIVTNQLGLCLGIAPAVCSYMHNDLNYREKEIEPGEGNGYYFNNGHCEKIKIPK